MFVLVFVGILIGVVASVGVHIFTQIWRFCVTSGVGSIHLEHLSARVCSVQMSHANCFLLAVQQSPPGLTMRITQVRAKLLLHCTRLVHLNQHY
jgi:hypothetical protein